MDVGEDERAYYLAELPIVAFVHLLFQPAKTNNAYDTVLISYKPCPYVAGADPFQSLTNSVLRRENRLCRTHYTDDLPMRTLLMRLCRRQMQAILDGESLIERLFLKP